MANKKPEAEETPAATKFEARRRASQQAKGKVGLSAIKNDDNELKQHSYRCTDEEFSQFQAWVDDINESMGKKGRGYTTGSVIRAVIHMRDNISDKQLSKALKESV